MPFTPLHFGPGASLKCAAQPYFSFVLFGYTQVMMDLEPAWFMLRQDFPLHRFVHTFVGATVMAILCLGSGRPLCQWWLRIWKRIPAKPLNEVFADGTVIPWWTAVITVFVGTYSHVFLDSIMHPDMRPFSPFSDANPMLRIIDIGLLHLLCLVLGVLGLLLWVRFKKR